jgi:pimeloyl-ACP methyl ester carboxylesterase/exonuclease VII small subunit
VKVRRVAAAVVALGVSGAVLAFGLQARSDAVDREQQQEQALAEARLQLRRARASLRQAEADLAAARAAVGDFAAASQGAVAAAGRLVELEGRLVDLLRRLRDAGAAENIGAYNATVDELNGSTDTINAAIDALDAPFEAFARELGRLPTARCRAPAGTMLEWVPYGESGLQCTRLRVPLDYAHPKRDSITITVVRRPADDPQDAKPLFINPGGPGVSAIAALRTAGLDFPPEILRRFDLIGMDPRGVGQSNPVDCGDDLDPLFDIDLTNADLNRRLDDLDEIEAIIGQCRKRSGPLLDHVDTVSVARDMDRVRAGLGEDQLSYLGYSYGTYLGAVYADLFPTRVRAAVLDGAVGPDYALGAITLDADNSFDESLDEALADCAADPGCPFHSDGDPSTAYDALLQKLQSEPAMVGDRPLGRGLAELGVTTALYAGQDGWPDLMDALAQASLGDGTGLLDLSDFYTGRRRDGSYSNENEAHAAVNCIEVTSRPIRDDARSKVRHISEEPDRFEAVDIMLSLPCAFWPAPPTKHPRRSIDGAGAAPIVVIGTAGDPVTPIEGAEAMADALDSGVLLVWEGDGHTAFGRDVACIDDAVTRYLVDLTVPAPDMRCPAA